MAVFIRDGWIISCTIAGPVLSYPIPLFRTQENDKQVIVVPELVRSTDSCSQYPYQGRSVYDRFLRIHCRSFCTTCAVLIVRTC
jgi:hypothetical protein